MGLIYDVAITALSGAAPADGFIDSKSSYYYMDTAQDAPNNLANAKAKFRANRRYRLILNSVAALGNCYVVSTTATGANADTAASTITIRFQVEHSDVLSTADESNSGAFLTGAAALKRAVARGLIITENIRGEYYDPTVQAGRQIDGAANAGLAKGIVIRDEVVGAAAASIGAAEAAITVTLV